MLTETVVAAFLLICLGLFFSISLHNILAVHKRKSGVKSYAEIERPSGLSVSLAVGGTLIYFLEALLYPFLAFTGLICMILDFPFGLPFPFIFCMRILGLVLTSIGYLLFIWSVVARGRYAASWEMPENQMLVTWGPYHYVRHPSYLGYFFMFFGLFFLWPNLFTLVPLVGIPGYLRVAFEEERLLTQRFGDDYAKYQGKTGRFLPKVR